MARLWIITLAQDDIVKVHSIDFVCDHKWDMGYDWLNIRLDRDY